MVCAAVYTQAATANWYAENIYSYADPTSSSLNSGYAVYFFEVATVSQADALSAISAGNWSFISNGFADDAVDSGEAYGTTTGHANGSTVTGYYIVFNDSDETKASHYYISDTYSDKIGGTGQAANLAWDASNTATAANWTAIPEPTSGLLMLVGLAGLALRRRRA